MNGTPPTRAEQFNSVVRGGITVALVLVFCYLAVVKVIDGQVFAQTVASVIAFWFASRGTSPTRADAPATPADAPETPKP